jgi:hypothetical protein
MNFGLKTLKVVILVAMLWGVWACNKVPDLTNSPSISMKSIRFVKDKTNNYTDTVIVQLNFTDGDGNLGLSASETTGKYSQYINGALNLNFYNILVEQQFKPRGRGNWALWPDSNTNINNLNGRFPLLFDNTSDQQPIKGVLEYKMKSLFWAQDSLMRFKIYIKDRSFNNSNTILTDSIFIKP